MHPHQIIQYTWMGGGYKFTHHCQCKLGRHGWPTTHQCFRIVYCTADFNKFGSPLPYTARNGQLYRCLLQQNRGTHSLPCILGTQYIWNWSISCSIWFSAAYIPCDTNVVANFHSHWFTENMEWNVFVILTSIFSTLGCLIALLPSCSQLCFLVARLKCSCSWCY